MTAARGPFSEAGDEAATASLFYLGSSLATLGGGGGIIVSVVRATPTGLALSAMTFVGGLIGNVAAERNLEKARNKYNAAKAKYYAAKNAYDECMLDSLPDDTG